MARMPEPERTAALLALGHWMSPAFPVGAFAYSHGLEWAVTAGEVRDAASLEAWVADLMRWGTGRTDAILLAAALRADADHAALGALAEALAASAERARETAELGAAFAAAVAAATGAPAAGAQATGAQAAEAQAAEAAEARARRAQAEASQAEAQAEASQAAGAEATGAEATGAQPAPLPYPVAVGAAARGLGLPAVVVIGFFLQGFAAGLVGAAIRLVPLGQADGQRVLARLRPLAAEVAAEAAGAPLDAIGGAAFRADVASMRHETMETRLFRT